MFDKIIQALRAPAEQSDPLTEQVAIAAILVEAAHADGIYLDAEKAMIDRILAQRFSVTPAAATHLRAQGEEAHAGATDLVRFTRVLKETVPIERRVGVIEAVWSVIYADTERDADEANLVRRLAGLLYVPDRDAGLARQRVASSLGME